MSKPVKVGASKKETEQILKFISGYETSEPPQSLKEIQGDFQLAGLAPTLHGYLSQTPTPKLLDIGCGSGILIAKLVELNAFQKEDKLEYIGLDFSENLANAFSAAVQFNVVDRVKLFPIDQGWTSHLSDPTVIIIRNVLHELSIDDASDIIHNVCSNLQPNSRLLLQDMTILPKAEKGRAGWIGLHIERVLAACGLNTVCTDDTSKTGINVFLIDAAYGNGNKFSRHQVKEMLIGVRKEQLGLLTMKYKEIQEKPGAALSLLRIQHDISAITVELGLYEDSKTRNDETVGSIIGLALRSITENQLTELISNFKYPKIQAFQNRSQHIDLIDIFLMSDKSILLITGGLFIGKKTLVWHVLENRMHKRLPIFISISSGSTLLEVTETIASQFGMSSYIDVTILSKLLQLPAESLKVELLQFIPRIADRTILILDGFENVVNNDELIMNDDIKWLINSWSNIFRSKIIIESRSHAELPMERCQVGRLETFRSSPEGKFGIYRYSVHQLQVLVPMEYRIAGSEFAGFPVDLLEAVDNHPYVAYLAGILIRNSPDSTCLNDPSFIMDIKKRLFENLISSFSMTDQEKDLVAAITLTRSPFPLAFLDLAFKQPDVIKKLISKGLILEDSPGLFRTIGVFKQLFRRGGSYSINKDAEQPWHNTFAKSYKMLYARTSKPSFYREYYYHSALAGDRSQLSAYNLPEISSCAEEWFRIGKYDDTIWAYKKIGKNRDLNQKEQMRFASCLIRSGDLSRGSEVYSDLFIKYPTWTGARSSLIDSLLYVQEPKQALENLVKFPHDKQNGYWYLQSAKANRQLGSRSEAYRDYEKAILASRTDKAWPIIQELASYAREVGDSSTEQEWIEDYAWNSLNLRSNSVMVELGAFYERVNRLSDAEKVLRKVLKEVPSNAYAVLALVKTLCRQGNLEEAKLIIDSVHQDLYPREVYTYARVFYLKSQKDFESAAKLFSKLPVTIHYYGQWADLFASWCLIVSEEERPALCLEGLKYSEEILKVSNVPALMSCRQLAMCCGDDELQSRIEAAIMRINSGCTFQPYAN